MIVEERQYSLAPRNKSAFWANYLAAGLPVQSRFLPAPLGFFFVDLGHTSCFVHMWAYRNYAHREDCRDALEQCEAWHRYMTSAHAYIESIEIRILKALPNEYAFLGRAVPEFDDA